jgi:hypothetical protein
MRSRVLYEHIGASKTPNYAAINGRPALIVVVVVIDGVFSFDYITLLE